MSVVGEGSTRNERPESRELCIFDATVNPLSSSILVLGSPTILTNFVLQLLGRGSGCELSVFSSFLLCEGLARTADCGVIHR